MLQEKLEVLTCLNNRSVIIKTFILRPVATPEAVDSGLVPLEIVASKVEGRVARDKRRLLVVHDSKPTRFI